MATPGSFVAGTALTAAEMNLLPAGWLAQAVVTADHAGIGAGPTDITGYTVTINTLANRRYRVSSMLHLLPSAAAGYQIDLLLNGVAQARMGLCETAGSTRVLSCGVQVVTPGALTAAVFKLTATRFNGAGTLTVQSSASLKGHLLIEDIGGV